jgi:hypothetical protein
MGSFDESDTQPPHLGPRPEEVDDDWNSTITPGPRVYREMSWTRHPIVVTLVIAAVVAIFFFGSRHGFRSWGTLLGILIITSYWVYPWTRYRYNMDWESDADPIGCLYPYGWPWW